VILIALLLAISPKFQQWAESPQAYFMTKAERAEWAAITTDDAAQQFVDKFVASRGPDFIEEVKTRAAIADKYLTVGKTPGSRSLRGKVIIVLGPPSSMNVSQRVEKGEHSATVSGYMNAAADGGPSIDDVSGAARREGMSGKEFRDFTFTYRNLTVTVEADAITGADRVPDRKQETALQERFEEVGAKPVVKTK